MLKIRRSHGRLSFNMGIPIHGKDGLYIALQWRHNGRDGVSNHQPHDCFLNRLFRHRSKKTSKLRVTGLCAGNSPEAGEFPAQMASNAENVSIWWRHHGWCVTNPDISTFRTAAYLSNIEGNIKAPALCLDCDKVINESWLKIDMYLSTSCGGSG